MVDFGQEKHARERAYPESHEDQPKVGSSGGHAEKLSGQGGVDGEVAAVPVGFVWTMGLTCHTAAARVVESTAEIPAGRKTTRISYYCYCYCYCYRYYELLKEEAVLTVCVRGKR